MLIERFQNHVLGADGDGRQALVSQIIVRTILIGLLVAGLVGGFIWIAAEKSDSLSIERQQHVIATVLDQSFRAIAHDQEAATVWDDSIRQLRAGRYDPVWIDENLGVWFNTYYGHDEIFIVDGANKLIYAMRQGRREDPAAYDKSIDAAGAALITELRAKLRRGDVVPKASSVLSPGAIDLGTIHGHPAIISVKPIIGDTGDLVDKPGTEHFHISIRYLDGSFIDDVARRYELADGQFSKTLPANGDLGSVALRTRTGALVGYFLWDPFRPGSAMLRQVAPALIVSLFVVFGLVGWLLRRISQNALQLSAAHSRAQHLADHDPLTGLANRAQFDKQLSAQLVALGGSGKTLALLYLDLDHFKNVNDHLGHPTGDLLISALSRILQAVSPDDLVARLGGDEFAIIHVADDAADSSDALAREIHRALARPIDLGLGEVLIGASIGIAVAPRDGTDPIDLVRKADIALYDAKHTGRRRHSFFTDAMGDLIRERSEIEHELREAMQRNQGISVVYQPFFAAQSGVLLGAEALVRWEHPTRGAMLPESFIPVAEECGLIETLNEWVLEQACRAAARWPSGTISVNLSPVQLRNPALAERVYAILKRARLTPGRLELEITETSFLEASEQCRSNLGWLRDIGVQVALDDFGTGYSSFKHLRGFEIDRVKIDQSFVAAIQLGQGGSPVIQAIVDLARLSGLATTAEGVETEQQRRYLTSIGCDVLQGYLLAEPLGAEEAEARFTVLEQ